jgi:hypothetical protein
MTNYADSVYYTNTYKGAVIDTASFDLYARKATQIIKRYTFNRVAENSIPDDVKMCCCELAETIYKHEKTEDNGNIASEKVGEYSVSYVDKEKAEQMFEGKCYKIITQWLAMTGLLYRGCR